MFSNTFNSSSLFETTDANLSHSNTSTDRQVTFFER
jgi:hypothetical protein